jgi:hypothetical protein
MHFTSSLAILFASASTACTFSGGILSSFFADHFEDPTWQPANLSYSGPQDPYIVKPSLGKGLGAFATRVLEPGDVILAEAPVLQIQPPPFQERRGYPLTEMGRSIRNAFESLTEELQLEVLSLHAYTTRAEKESPDVDELVPIFRSNAYTTDRHISLFPKIARINHSCRPNTSYIWNKRLGKQVLYATRRIEQGEELSVSYIPLLYNRSDRQKRLKQYGFKCSCEACSGDNGKSDTRRDRIRRAFSSLEPQLTLDGAQDTGTIKQSRLLADQSIELAHLVEEEGLADYRARAYRVAAIAHAMVAAWENATLYAHKSYQLRLMADSKSPEANEMEILTSRFISSWNDDLRKKSLGTPS